MWPVSIACAAQPAPVANVHHALTVALDPATHRLSVEDAVLLPPDDDRTWTFALHAGLAPTVATKGWTLRPIEAPADAEPAEVPVEWFELRSKKRTPRLPVVLAWKGPIDHAPAQVPTEYQRAFAQSAGVVGPDGVYLAGSTRWLPELGDGLVTFDLSVTGLPSGWEAVSQGERTAHDRGATTWRAADPTDEVYLVAGPWTERAERWVRADGTSVDVRAFLRSDDPALAGRYLAATQRYLALYESMLPRFPYPSFAVVENFWDTGYGMPGFTLLGPQVIRFPFVLTSSYPHELLHNWWGNSAYLDPDAGNWCEGLTAYLADHLFAEQRGEGASYRRTALQRYTDYVGAAEDFPLTAFTERSSASSEAVGYGKSLMLFHMARKAVGDEAFVAGLARFYEAHRFAPATFADLADALSEGGVDVHPLFDAWTTRVGAPVLVLAGAERKAEGAGWSLSVAVEQTGVAAPFPMTVPVAVTVEGEPGARWMSVSFTDATKATATLAFDKKPLRVDVDPRYDVMRRLDPLEVPAAISTVLGSDAVTYVLPSKATPAEQDAWRGLAAKWAAPGTTPTVVTDAEATTLPKGSAWVLGWDNALAGLVAKELAADGVKLEAASVTSGGKTVPRKAHSAVLVARAPGDPTSAVGWIGADPLDAIPGLARKLPHYGKYAALVFDGAEPTNSAKTTFDPRTSPLVRGLDEGPLPALSVGKDVALRELPSRFDRASLLATATALSAPEMEGRGVGSAGLDTATAWVEARGKAVAVPFERRMFAWTGGEPSQERALANLVWTLPGTDPAAAPVLVTAHLDHLGTGWPDVREGNAGKVHPGADDNASGVAVALEVARMLATEGPHLRPIVVAVTTGEEAGLVGSRHLLADPTSLPRPFACVNLDTVGRRTGDAPITVIGAGSAREFSFAFQGIGFTTGIPTALAPDGLASSDQVACQELGVPGVQLTTGANADYHRPTDTADKLNADGMVAVADVAWETIAWLADRAEPLTVQLAGAPAQPASAGARKVSLGTMPDFGFAGPGVRVQEVMAGSPAAAAGIAPGDVVVSLGGAAVTDLRGYSDLLKSHAAGDKVEVVVLRGDKKVTVHAVLTAR